MKAPIKEEVNNMKKISGTCLSCKKNRTASCAAYRDTGKWPNSGDWCHAYVKKRNQSHTGKSRWAGRNDEKTHSQDTMQTEEQKEHNQQLACLADDIAFKLSLLRIAETALEDIHKIVRDAQVKAAEMRAIEYGDDVEVPNGECS